MRFPLWLSTRHLPSIRGVAGRQPRLSSIWFVSKEKKFQNGCSDMYIVRTREGEMNEGETSSSKHSIPSGTAILTAPENR